MADNIDNLSHLEGRVEGLIHHLEKAFRSNEELRKTKKELAEQIESMREHAAANAEKEDLVRDRLKSILTKIDNIEQEISSSDSNGNT